MADSKHTPTIKDWLGGLVIVWFAALLVVVLP